MIDVFLRAADAAAMRAALAACGLGASEGAGHQLWMLGDFARVPAVLSADGMSVTTPPVMVGAFHANLVLFGPKADATLAALTAAGVVIPAPPQPRFCRLV